MHHENQVGYRIGVQTKHVGPWYCKLCSDQRKQCIKEPGKYNRFFCVGWGQVGMGAEGIRS